MSSVVLPGWAPVAPQRALDRDRQSSVAARWRLRAFAMRDLRGRFTATALGVLWTFLVPIATVVTYGTAFFGIFRAKAQATGNGHPVTFAVWFFVGLVSWNVPSQLMMGAMGAILGMQ